MPPHEKISWTSGRAERGRKFLVGGKLVDFWPREARPKISRGGETRGFLEFENLVLVWGKAPQAKIFTISLTRNSFSLTKKSRGGGVKISRGGQTRGLLVARSAAENFLWGENSWIFGRAKRGRKFLVGGKLVDFWTSEKKILVGGAHKRNPCPMVSLNAKQMKILLLFLEFSGVQVCDMAINCFNIKSNQMCPNVVFCDFNVFSHVLFFFTFFFHHRFAKKQPQNGVIKDKKDPKTVQNGFVAAETTVINDNIFF